MTTDATTSEYPTFPISSLLRGGSALMKQYPWAMGFMLLVYGAAVVHNVQADAISIALLWSGLCLAAMCWMISSIWMRIPLPGKDMEEARRDWFKKGWNTFTRTLGVYVLLVITGVLNFVATTLGTILPGVALTASLIIAVAVLAIKTYIIFFTPFMTDRTFMDKNLAVPWRLFKANKKFYFFILLTLIIIEFSAGLIPAMFASAISPQTYSCMMNAILLLAQPVLFFGMLCILDKRRELECTLSQAENSMEGEVPVPDAAAAE